MKDLLRHPIRFFALLLVAVVIGYVMWMAERVNDTLSGPGWCRTALGAEKASATDGTIKGLDACVGLLTIQLKSLSTNSHILFGALVLVVVVLVVIVIAGAKLTGEVNETGAKIDLSGDSAAKAADQVAGAAVNKADEIKDAQP